MVDIQLRIFAPAGAVHRVEGLLDNSAQFVGEAQFDFSALRQCQDDPQAYGLVLRAMLFASGELQRAWDQASAGGEVRLRLLLDPDAGEVHQLRWESLMMEHNGESLPLAASPQTPFSRYAALPQAPPPVLRTGGFRLLLAVANPSGLKQLAPIDADGEVENLLSAWAQLLENGEMRVTILAGHGGLSPEMRARAAELRCVVKDGATTLDTLEELLSEADGIHLIAHGNLSAAREAVLVLEKPDGSLDLVEQALLLRKFNHPSLRFAFLQSCKSSGGAAFAGLGPQLVQLGVPAVIAMQDFVPMADARRFASVFYTTFIRDGALDLAANAGRQAILRSSSANWSIPVLFSRLQDPCLWPADPLRAGIHHIAGDYGLEELVKRPFPLEAILLRTGVDTLQHGTEDVAGPKLDLLDASREALKGSASPFVLLIGNRGRNKSTHLRRMFVLAEEQFRQDGAVMPVYLKLSDCANVLSTPARTLAGSVARMIQEHGFEVDAARVRDAFERRRFLFLLDGDDDFGAEERVEALGVLAQFRRTCGEHQFFVSVDEATLDPGSYPPDSTALLIQLMPPDRVTAYLEQSEEESVRELVEKLRQTALFDLAAVPWLLARLMSDARNGIRIDSRAGVLDRFVRNGLLKTGAFAGVRERAEEALGCLAWRMQASRTIRLEGAEVFSILAGVRRNREFSLEEFLTDILKSDLLVRSGAEGVRFAYPGLQSYYCARHLMRSEDRERCLEDITASLGRISRVRWWEDTLAILAGLSPSAGSLLRKILAGSGLREGDQVFLAARCLHEARRSGRTPASAIGQDVVDQIVDTLLWRSHPQNVRSAASRRKAIEAFAILPEPRVIPHLLSLAIGQVRLDWEGERSYDLSSVRQAAVTALLGMIEDTIAFVKTDPVLSQDKRLEKLIGAWLSGDVSTLGSLLGQDDASVAGVAAFALGTIGTDDCVDLLVKRFAEFAGGNVNQDILWAITDTLSLLNPVRVTERAIIPFLDRPVFASHVAYLIGKLRIAPLDGEECGFLRQCLLSDNHQLQGRALRSLACLYSMQRHKPGLSPTLEELRGVCHELVLDDFASAAKRGFIQVSTGWQREQQASIRYQALEALRSVGDVTSIEVLRQVRRSYDQPSDEPGVSWFAASINQLSFEIGEEIFWRLTGGLSGETFLPLQPGIPA
ncbi:MAG TPA: CHAT domain-containing protein [Paludibaculum sp.]|jgi:hypothetical protein